MELFVCVVVGLSTGHALFNFKPSVPRSANDGKNATYSDKDKGFNGRTSSKEEEEIVDPCCQYMAMEDDSEHVLTDKSNKSNKIIGNTTNNPLL